MLRFIVTTDLPENLRLTEQALDSEMSTLLERLGTQLLDYQKFDFEKKSRGGTGEDGTRWEPLSQATEILKAKRGKGYKAPSTARAQLRRRLKRTKDVDKRAKIKEQIEATHQQAIPKSQIGVDTGHMRNAVNPGYRAQNQGFSVENVFNINRTEVTVGYRVQYGTWFDEGTANQPARPLMPNTLPRRWEDGLQKIVDEWAGELLERIN